jgi:D-3-phosphoglycerate dehydrogenase
MLLIADLISPVHLQQIKDLKFVVEYHPKLDDKAFSEFVAKDQPEIIVVRSRKVNKAHIASNQKLKTIIRAGAGVDNIDVKAATESGVQVCNIPGKNSVAVAELVLAHMLSSDRKLPQNYITLKSGKWNKEELSKAQGLKGKVIGIIGFGNIGKEVARRAIGFDMKVVFSSVEYPVGAEVKILDHVCRSLSFDEVLQQSDFVTLHVPFIKQTTNMINKDFLAKLKKTCVLINTSRGEVANEEDLLAHLNANPNFVYATDVLRNEPTFKKGDFSSALAQHPNVYATCHIGASTAQAEFAIGEGLVENLAHFKKNSKLLCVVNPQPKL